MTLLCSHRVNTRAQLDKTPHEQGVEIDLHGDGDRLVLTHDPFSTGETFDEWLEGYQHAFIVVNTKEEGLEARASALLAERGITEWAFLDQSFPYLIRTLLEGETRSMVRVSEYETIGTALALPRRPDWVWLDSFTGAWPREEELVTLHEHGFKLMVVSPELQGRSLDEEFVTITNTFERAGLQLDGVCTKRPEAWDLPDSSWWKR